MTTPIETKEQLEQKLVALGDLDDETKAKIACALIGHSCIAEVDWDRYYCGRCGYMRCDLRAGPLSYFPDMAVVIGDTSEENKTRFAECTWRDTFMAPDPFADELAS